MFSSARIRASTVVIAVAIAIGCSSDPMPPSPNDPGSQRPPDELTVVRLSTTAPPLEESSVSFWAVKGVSTEQKLYFLAPGGERGEEYLALKLDGESLRLRPDGSMIAEGDSVLITITVEDPALLLFSLQPTGLKFSADKPAELRIRYAHCDGDLNEDGEVNAEDGDLETVLGIWRQELPTQPFVRLGSVRVDGEKELEANLEGFSRYAIAY